MIKNCALFFVFVFAASALWAEPRETALEKEKKGDRAGAVASYEEWLAANRASPEFTKILFHAADIHPQLKSSIALLEKYRTLASGKAAQSAICGKTATLYEVSGNLVKAQTLFEEAYYANPGEETFPFLYRAARLYFELGETQKSEDLARVVANLCAHPVTKKRAAFLLTRILAASGKLEEALRLSLRLTEDSAPPADNESIFLFIFTLADSLGRETERSLALQKLAKDYPDSPEFRLASRAAGEARPGAVTPLPTPQVLLNPLPEPEIPPAVLPQPPPPRPAARAAGTETGSPSAAEAGLAASAVQTGSFSVRENAEYMARDLKRLGFDAEIREAAGKAGGRIYKVVIPLSRGGQDESQTLLIRLKDKGMEGFLLF